MILTIYYDNLVPKEKLLKLAGYCFLECKKLFKADKEHNAITANLDSINLNNYIQYLGIKNNCYVIEDYFYITDYKEVQKKILEQRKQKYISEKYSESLEVKYKIKENVI
jgi:hypothetical protein